MKISITTLTGQKFVVEVDEEETVKDLKRTFYKTSKLTSQVRLLQGQTVLHDDRKLCEYQMQDGGVSALFQPDVDVAVEVTSGYRTFNLKVPNSTVMKQIKARVGEMAKLSTDKFDLIYEEVTLEDDLPLHLYGITTGSRLQVLRHFVSVTITSNNGNILYTRVKRDNSAYDLKKKLLESQAEDEQNGRLGHPEDMRLYLVEGEEYNELEDEMTVLECGIRDNSELFLLSYKWTNPSKGGSIRVWKSDRKIKGVESCDTPLAVKLRAQDQLGAPVKEFGLIRDENLKDCVELKFAEEYFIATETEVKEENERRDREKERVRVEREGRKQELEAQIQRRPGEVPKAHMYRVLPLQQELNELYRLLNNN